MSAYEHDEEDTRVTLARLEAKLDVALAQHTARLDRLTDQGNDHERRLRAVEARPLPPSVASMLAALMAVMTVLVAVVALLDRLYT